MPPLADVAAAFRWLLVLELVLLAGLPLARRLFRHLPGAAYPLARPLGLLAGAYLLWMLSALGLLRVEGVSFAGTLVLVLAIGLVAGGRLRPAPGEGHPALTAEIVFLLTFLAAAWFRSFAPEIEGTEKPMEFAFLNSIMRDGRVPPANPWLSGYAISYYYFGYLMVAALAKAAAVPPALAFNLGLATLFALAFTGAFALMREMVARYANSGLRDRAPVVFGGLAGVSLTVMGNLEGFLEVLHARGLLPASFWRWLDLKDLLEPAQPGAWMPDRYLWWWRASRVINDRSPLGDPMEVIDEFPFFSFLLGDMHPHVLALPFVVLAVALAVEWALRLHRRPRLGEHRGFLLAAATTIGGLAFLNTWDWPIYLALFAAATWVGLGDDQRRLRRTMVIAAAVAFTGLVAYAPFFLAFQSQASGILPHYLSPTRLSQFLVMFGPLLLPAVALAAERLRTSGPGARLTALRWWAGLFTTPYLLLLVIGAALLVLPAGQEALDRLQGMAQTRELLEDANWLAVLLRMLLGKLTSPWMMLVVTAVMAAALARLTSPRPTSAPAGASDEGEGEFLADVSLAMVGLGLALTWAVEFVYLRDYFGTRMNTVFKFYYQAWVLLSLSGAYAAYHLWRRWQGYARLAFGVAAAALGLLGLVYAPLSLWTRTDALTGPATLNGLAHLERHRADEAEALAWLQDNVPGMPVILEAVGGSYSEFARVSANTGLPTPLGWDFHEMQWRGTSEHSVRKDDVTRLYTTRSWEEALSLLQAYRVRYVYIGRVERQAYGEDAGALLAQRLPAAFRSTDGTEPVSILQVPETLLD